MPGPLELELHDVTRCEPSRGVWELKPGFLKEHPVLLTTEQSL